MADDDDDTPRNADFIEKVVSDAKDPPETRLLTGWLGDAADEGYRRLYTNAELSAYIDIPVAAILHSEPMRDAQPPGAVFVWIRRDADLKQGGSAFSRAARFLQGQVTRDFAGGGGGLDLSSPEKAGYRCITQVPCGEPTGITGKCTKQPEVGGAWPCVTAIPHCFEPTGFTGQCTHQPWPNPTHYIGCTFLHCPTQDLTHIPQICHIVATGMPGCGFVDPGSGGIDPAAKVGLAEEGKEGGGAAEQAAAPATSIPGCGYTRTWGLCPTLPPKCIVSVNIDCITQDNACGPTRNPACLANATDFAFRAAGPGVSVAAPCPSALDACPSKLCPTVPPTGLCTQIPDACPPTKMFQNCPTKSEEQCPTFCGVHCQTQPENCTQLNCTHVAQCPSIGIVCTTFPAGCPVTTLEHNCGAAQPQAFRAAAPIGPSAFLGCTQTGAQCPTYPSGDCTFFGCPTIDQAGAGGPCCTQSGPKCPTQPNGDCTFFGNCPPTPATTCTQTGPQCPSQFGSGCPTDTAQDCTFGCTQFGPSCPTNAAQNCNPNLVARIRPTPTPFVPQLGIRQLQTNHPIWCHPNSGLPFDCPFPSLFFVCTAVHCTIVQCFRR